ncbi:unnamed protein product [Didymodactylos carnosus]|uniref:FLYWCH-type domain-containing protein n=1 Tax=Didymodactylos carnosus TaxID=1234261 RepID=A0A8S2YDJ8_9BILA|nr:unnamed protein product [Didymodactylos carnosus]
MRNENTYWLCENRSTCNGRAVQRRSEAPVVSTPHNHELNVEPNEREEFRTNLKRRIREEPVSVRKLFRSELVKIQTTSPDNVSTLPQFDTIKNSLYRIRNEKYPPLPKSIEDVKLEGKTADDLTKFD